MDYEVKRFTRRCAVSERELQPGETYFTALVQVGGEVVRRDYAAAAWQGPPTGTVGWWTSQVPTPESVRQHWAPQDVMLQLFEELADQPDQGDLRYLLTLLMIRRRILRVQSTEVTAEGEFLVVHSAKLDQEERVRVMEPTPSRRQAIEAYLRRLVLDRAA